MKHPGIDNKQLEQNLINTGKYFGYPQCCIDEFILSLKGEHIRTAEQTDPEVHKFKGFIPCSEHARLIKLGKIKIEKLISKRQCPRPYPSE